MIQSDNNHTKILFRFYSNTLEKWTVETLWAKVIDVDKGLYKIDDLPFYVSIASDDIVFAEFDDTEKALTYRKSVEYSGNSTVQVVILDKTVVTNSIRDIFSKLGCQSEKLKEGYFTLEVPRDKDYKIVKQKLSELFNIGAIDHAEVCLSENHSY